MMTITSLSTGITSLLFFAGGIRLYFSWRKEKTVLLKFFTIFLLAFGFQQLFFSLGTGILSLSSGINTWLWGIAHIFMFIGISYFIRFPLHIRSPRLEKIIFRIAAIYSLIGIIVLFLYVPKVISYLMENGVYIFVVPSLAGAVIGIFTTACLLLSCGLFLAEGIKLKEKKLKVRAFILAFGILIFLVGGPMHNFVKTPLLTFVADASIIFGAGLMVVGVYINQILATFKKTGPI